MKQSLYHNSLFNWNDDSRAQHIERAHNYISKIPSAVAGQQGHDRTFYVANILVGKFKLDYEDSLELLLEFNERCEPPWSVAELNHKLLDAIKKQGEAAPTESLIYEWSIGVKHEPDHQSQPRLSQVFPFTAGDATTLEQMRGIPACGTMLAAERGLLFTTLWQGHTCYGARDLSGNLIELRRMDCQLFPGIPDTNIGPRKSHAVRGSKKSWPLGIHEAKDYPAIALVEGLPDFLYTHFRICEEHSYDRVAAVAMLSATPRIDSGALHLFAGKRIRIFPHADPAGWQGAQQWYQQLTEVNAQCEIYDLSGLHQENGTPVKDLCDLLGLSETDKQAQIKNILP